ncbi:S8 family peptidase [Arenimonas terrae]|uniref:Peptidase S8 n=1 Tax=Arenimonas terrae TaxID=2546226 RepID=A0A5C4RNS1_9GAMM|nr:S8 family peptidase [Arenimonas terrae]TNJ32893.1 peptidase S8 [Arenimonas terrae]
MKSAFRTTLLAAATLAALGAASSAVAGGRPDLVAKGLAEGRAHVADQLIVQFRAGATEADKQRVMRRVNGDRAEVLARGHRRIDIGGDIELMNLRGRALRDAIADLQADGAVEFAEPNWILQHTAVSNDTYYTNGSLWGMYGDNSSPANQYGSRAAEVWAKIGGTDCSNVVIGVIDEGYMYNHADLAANAFKNPGDSTFDGVDNDGNGLVDDVYGWDFDGNNNSVFDGTGDDHGTHVAGTIGGVGGNGVGVAGVCWNVKLMGAKFLGNRGGTTANAVKAVDYFTDLKVDQGLNIVATNNSWGGGGFSQALLDAINRANAAGILFVAAAGNSGANNDTTASYPSNYNAPNVIAVAALTSTGALASYSQYGATTVDLGAPGSGIWSTVPVASGKGKNATVTSGYSSYSGTSMATPHVTGAVALYAARNPGASAAQIKAAILGSTTPTPSLSGKTVTGGRLNVEGF